VQTHIFAPRENRQKLYYTITIFKCQHLSKKRVGRYYEIEFAYTISVIFRFEEIENVSQNNDGTRTRVGIIT